MRTREQLHKDLVKLIRCHLSLRLVKVKKRGFEKYPEGHCDIVGRQITIEYMDGDDLDWIDALIIHEYGHMICATKFGFNHHPVCDPVRIIEEECRAWDEGEKWLMRLWPHLRPKKFDWIKKYCLDTYEFVYGNYDF